MTHCLHLLWAAWRVFLPLHLTEKKGFPRGARLDFFFPFVQSKTDISARGILTEENQPLALFSSNQTQTGPTVHELPSNRILTFKPPSYR